MKTYRLVFPEKLYHFKNTSIWYFNSHFVLKHSFYIIEKTNRTENQQLFDRTIDITLFDGVSRRLDIRLQTKLLQNIENFSIAPL